MKRLFFSAALLAACFSVCLSGHIKIEKGSAQLTDELNKAFYMINEEQSEVRIENQIEKCVAQWERIKPVFSFFLSHDVFSSVDNIIPTLKNSFLSNKKICADKILSASVSLNNIIEQQKLSLENLL